MTSTQATYEDTFEDFCEGLDLLVHAEIRYSVEDGCEFDVLFTVKDGATTITEIGFEASLSENTNCSAFNDFALAPGLFSGSGDMVCTEPTNDCLVDAV